MSVVSGFLLTAELLKSSKDSHDSHIAAESKRGNANENKVECLPESDGSQLWFALETESIANHDFCDAARMLRPMCDPLG